MEKLKVLDLFSGIGGFSLGLERTGGFETVAFCEIDPFCQKVLKKHWPNVYIHDDVRTLGDNLWERIAQNALLNQLCAETGGNTTCAKNATMNIKTDEETKTAKDIENIITDGLLKNENQLLSIMAGSAFAAESPNTLFLQSITNSIMEILKERNTKERFGSSPSKEDCQAIIKYYAITAIRQRRSADNALMSLIEIYNDVRTLEYDGPVDVITGGYPCQPFSVAGNRKGKDDDRHLWPAMFSLVKKHRPTWVIGENVAGHINMGLDDVLADLESAEYSVRTFVIPACAVNAPHRRDRVWTVGYAEYNGLPSAKKCREFNQTIPNNSKGQKSPCKPSGASGSKYDEDVADSTGVRQSRSGKSIQPRSSAQARKREADITIAISQPRVWSIEPDVGRVAHGVPNRMDRLKSLGNAVVPQIPEMIGYAILMAHPTTAGERE